MKERRKKWTKEQLENFLRQETSMMDSACKREATVLIKVVNILINCDPDDYTERKD